VRRLLSPKSWVDLSIESYWKLRPKRESSLSRTWQINAEDLKLLTVYWPTVYEWPPAEKWVSHILMGLKKYVNIRFSDIPQKFEGIVLIGVDYYGKDVSVAIDYSDDGERIDEECLKECAAYFKMQFQRKGYHHKKIIPGLYVPSSLAIYSFLPDLRAMKQNKLSYEVYGRFSKEFASDIREKAVRLLKNQGKFEFSGDLNIVRYSRYLREAASSKICIDLPGIGDFCFRLIDYLAIGSCVIGPPHRTALYPPLEDKTHLVYCKSDLSDLLDLCTYYLDNDVERQRITRNSREYFDKYLHKDNLAGYYISNIMKCLVKHDHDV
jgi:hypothetical protein